MRNMMKFAGALVVMTTFAGFAQEKAKAPMTASQAMAHAKEMDAKERQVMKGHCQAMDQQITVLEQSLKAGGTEEQARQIVLLRQSLEALKIELARTPHYFDPVPGGGMAGQ
jgi:hypothetical protein